MKLKYHLLTALLISAVQLIAQPQSGPPAGGTPKDFKLPEKDVSKLSNGLSASLVQYGAIPKVNISIIVKTGNIHEGPNEVWLADLTGNMIREGGTTSMNYKAIAKKVAAMGGEVNVTVNPNQTIVSGSVLSEFAPELIKVLADIVMNPAFPATELDRLKNDLKRNLAVQKTVPQSLATEKFRSILYKGHAYGRIFPTEEMLNSYTLEMVKGFYDKNFGAKRTAVYAVGKFNEAATKKSIEDTFGKWTPGPEINYPRATPVKTNEIAIIDRPNAPQTTIILGLPTLDPSKPDYLPLQVTNSLLGGSFGSRITKNIREDKGYTYSPFSTVNNGYRAAIWYEQADVTSESTGAALQEISNEIKRLQVEPLSKDELKGIQNYEAGIFVLRNSSPGGIINQLNFIDLHGLPESYLSDNVKNIYNVTPEKVQQLAKDYFKYEDMALVLVGDKKLIEKQIKAHQDALKVK
jgi:zinc protease